MASTFYRIRVFLTTLLTLAASSNSLATQLEAQNSTSPYPTLPQPESKNQNLSTTPKPLPGKLCPPTESCVRVTNNCTLSTGKVSFNLAEIVNATKVIVPGFEVEGKKKSMILSMCRGFKESNCASKNNSQPTACLLDGPYPTNEKLMKARNANSIVVGVFTNSKIRLSKERLNWESSTYDKLCSLPAAGQNVTEKQPFGTRVEFFCSPTDHEKPTFLALKNCTYIFEWGFKSICANLTTTTTKTIELSKVTLPTNNTGTNPPVDISHAQLNIQRVNPEESSSVPKLSDEELKIHLNQEPESAQKSHEKTFNEAANINAQNQGFKEPPSSSSSTGSAGPKPQIQPMENSQTDRPAPSKMNRMHKFLMISLIIMSLGSFIVVIFILDQKTRLRLPLTSIRRRARQAFQSQPVPYKRVDDFNDSLHL